MEGRRFDDLTKVMARPAGRRGFLKGMLAAALGGAAASIGGGAMAAKGGNSVCAQWCHDNFSGSAAGQCTSEAARGLRVVVNNQGGPECAPACTPAYNPSQEANCAPGVSTCPCEPVCGDPAAGTFCQEHAGMVGQGVIGFGNKPPKDDNGDYYLCDTDAECPSGTFCATHTCLPCFSPEGAKSGICLTFATTTATCTANPNPTCPLGG